MKTGVAADVFSIEPNRLVEWDNADEAQRLIDSGAAEDLGSGQLAVNAVAKEVADGRAVLVYSQLRARQERHRADLRAQEVEQAKRAELARRAVYGL